VHAAKGLEFPVVVVPDMGTSFPHRYPPIMIGDNPLLVGVKVPNPAENYEMTESAVLLALREQQRQKERAEKKRLLYVALTRARDHLIMSGTPSDDPSLSFELAQSRIEWIFTALGITGDAVAAGGMELLLPDGTGSVRLAIVSEPLSIPAESGRVRPSLIVVPEEFAGKAGTWAPRGYVTGPGRVKPISVSDLEEEMHRKEPIQPPVPAREPVVSKYLPEVEGTKKGTIIHEVLRGRDAATVLREYGEYSEEHVRQCEEIRAAFLSSDLMKKVKRSFCEVPFVISYEGGQVVGKVDRLCELGEGEWVVVDYKSEPVKQKNYANITMNFENSINAYVTIVKDLIGEIKVSMVLYFTETGDFFNDFFRFKCN
jgi:ATP-dependent helicase/nuclease subunit A